MLAYAFHNDGSITNFRRYRAFSCGVPAMRQGLLIRVANGSRSH